MTNPNVDDEEMGDKFKDFLDECAAGSDMEDEDDFFNQDDRDMTDYNYQNQKDLHAVSQGFADDDDDDD